MSLNDKYIINGSTLSDIGDALRAKKIISPTKKGTKTIFCYGCKDSQGYGSSEKSMSGIGTNGSNNDRLPVGSKALFYMNTNQYITSAGLTDYTGKKIAKSAIPTTFQNSIEVTLPLSGTASAAGWYGSQNNFWFYFYPFKNDTDFYEEGQFDYSNWSLNSYAESASYQEKTVTVKNTIAVENIATSISQFTSNDDKIQFLAPFCIGGYSNYSSYSTVLPEDIHTMTDIKKLYVIVQAGSSSNIRVAKLEPAIAVKKNYSSLPGSLGSGTTYQMKFYDFYRTTPAAADWETTLNNSTSWYEVFYKENTRQLVQTDSSTIAVQAIGVAALLIY